MSARFDVKRRIETSLGIRYGAVDLHTGKPARLQRIPEHGAEYELDTNLFASAAQALPAIQHPNLVPVLELCEDPDGAYAASAYAEGDSLADFIATRGPLNVKDAISVATDCLLGLGALFAAGWRHGDPSPHRVIVRRGENNRLDARLAEVGFTLLVAPSESLHPGSALPWREMGFVAPEVILQRPADVRADLYSLGCTLYFALTGKAPFAGETDEATAGAHLSTRPIHLLERKRDLPPKTADWIMSLIEADPASRPASPEHALEMLETARGRVVQASAHAPTPARMTVPRANLVSPSSQRSRVIPRPATRSTATRKIIVGGLLAATLIAGGWWIWLGNRAKHSEQSVANISPIPAASSSPATSISEAKTTATAAVSPHRSGPPEGRYLRIELPRKGTLTLAEVEVFSGGKNIAVKCPATQSSTAYGGLAQRAVDGNSNGRFNAGSSTHTSEGDPHPWWEVDLKAVRPIEAVTVWNRTDGNGTFTSRLEGYQVVLLDANRRQVFRSLPNPAPARSARIELSARSETAER